MRSAGSAADVWTDLSVRPHRSKKRADGVVPWAAGLRTDVSDDAPLWRVALAVVEPVRWERVLGIALAASCGSGLVWLALVCAQFVLAWANLVAWVRAAML